MTIDKTLEKVKAILESLTNTQHGQISISVDRGKIVELVVSTAEIFDERVETNGK